MTYLYHKRVKPFSHNSLAFARLRFHGLTLADALNMTDSELLRLPNVGRRTVAFVRTFPCIQ